MARRRRSTRRGGRPRQGEGKTKNNDRPRAGAGVDDPENDVTNDRENEEGLTQYGLPAWADNPKQSHYGATIAWLRTGTTEGYYAQRYRTGGGGLLQYGSTAHGFNIVPGEISNSVPNRAFKQRRPGSGRWRPAQDNNITANQVIEQFIELFSGNAKMKQRAAEVQQLLFEGGFYGAAKPLLGAFGEDDLEAFMRALIAARLAGGRDNLDEFGEGIPLDQFLEQASGAFAAQGVMTLAEMNAQRKPREAHYTNEMEIIGMANAGGSDSNATSVLGHSLTGEEMEKYLAYIKAGEDKEADQIYAADEIINIDGTTKGGDITEAAEANLASLDAFQAKENPTDYGSHKIGMMAVEILADFQRHSPGGTGSQ